MKKSILSYISGKQRSFQTQISEYAALLDLISPAALLVDSTTQNIIYINSSAKNLFRLAKIYPTHLTVNDLIDEWEVEDLSSLKQGSNSIITQTHVNLGEDNTVDFDVQLTYSLLPPDGERGLIILEPEISDLNNQAQANEEQVLWDNLIELISFTNKDNIQQAIEQILQIGHQLTSASMLAVYMADQGSPTAIRFAEYGKPDWLPHVLLPEDMVKLRAPYLWKHEKQVLSVIHNKGNNTGINYIATAPLGNGNAVIGTLVIADDHNKRETNLLELTILLAAQITVTVQKFATRSHDRLTIENQVFKLKVGDKIEDSIREGLLLLSPDLTIERINYSAEVILGYTRQEAKGQPVELFIIGSENLSQILQKARDGISTENIRNIRLYRRSGEAFSAQISVYPISKNGAIPLIMILVSDLSEQEQIQEQAQQLEQHAFLGEVSAVFAHEVRNPINNISTGLELMAYNLEENDSSREIIARLQDDCDRLEELMKSVLTFSKPTEYTMVQVDIELLLNRLLTQFKPQITLHNIHSQLQIDPEIPAIMGNFRALEQVFTNLIDNAVQVMSSKGGQLSVKVQIVREASSRKMVQISIADEGPGIPEEDMEHIFQPFYTTRRTGTGLGLAISKRIITGHKGNINVKSFPGGSIFQVQIPALAKI
jgi:PAS domain S-box-containing protein